MAILFAGGEDCDAELVTAGVGFDTGGNGRRVGYGRGALFTQYYSNTDPNDYRVKFLKWNAPASDFWASFYWYAAVNGALNTQWVSFYDPAGVRRLVIRGTGGDMKLSTRNAAGTLADIGVLTSANPNLSQTVKVDIHVNYAAAGSVSIYFNGVLKATVSGNLLTDAATTLQQLEIGGLGYGDRCWFSEVIVATTDTRSMSLVTLTTSNAGAAQNWTGAAANVNQAAMTNDAQYVWTDTNDTVQQYLPGALPVGAFNVKALVHSARALVGATGPQHLAFVTRVGSTDYASPDKSPLQSFGGVNHIQETNPATAAAWSVDDITPALLQYGIKSRA
jgi:hypothetical protein